MWYATAQVGLWHDVHTPLYVQKVVERLQEGDDIDGTNGRTEEEIDEELKRQEAKTRARTLEIVRCCVFHALCVTCANVGDAARRSPRRGCCTTGERAVRVQAQPCNQRCGPRDDLFTVWRDLEVRHGCGACGGTAVQPVTWCSFAVVKSSAITRRATPSITPSSSSRSRRIVRRHTSR